MHMHMPDAVGESTAQQDFLTKSREATRCAQDCLNLFSNQLDGSQPGAEGDACEVISQKVDGDNPDIVTFVVTVNLATKSGTAIAQHQADGVLHTTSVATTK